MNPLRRYSIQKPSFILTTQTPDYLPTRALKVGNPRFATTDDIPHLVDVINRAYVAEAPFVHGPRTSGETVHERMLMPNTWFIVIEANATRGPRQIAGCVCLDCDGHRGHIGLLSVEPDFQGRGLGAKLLRAAESQCQMEMCCPEIELEVVSVRDDLFPFYAKMGYERVGTVPFPIESLLKQPAHLVVMRRSKGRL